MNNKSTWLIVLGLTGLLLPDHVCKAQTEAFTRSVACPSDASITGYTSLADLNADMAAELARIEGGGQPLVEYNLNLCSNPDAIYDARGGNEIRPVLSGLNIYCGGPTATDAVCIINGGQIQVLINDSDVASYPIGNILLKGMTFRNFNGRSVEMNAQAPTTITFEDTTWQVTITYK
jgi:hypothetical protein